MMMPTKRLAIMLVLLVAAIARGTLRAAQPNVSVVLNPTASSAMPGTTATAIPASPAEKNDSSGSESDDKDAPNSEPAKADKGTAAAPPEKDTEPNADETIYLNFENASLASVVNYLAEQKKINDIPLAALSEQKVSLTTRKPLSLERAFDVLRTLLEVNGFTLINVDNLYRIVPSANNGFEPLPYYNSQTTDPNDLPNSDIVVRYLYFFKNMKPEAAQDILRTMFVGDGAVQILRDMQACVIKEKCYNIKAAIKIISELDTGGLRESIRIIPLKDADADTVQKLFSDILGNDGSNNNDRLRFITADQAQESSYFSSSTKIISEPVKNSLILLGTEKNINRISDFIYKYIDVPIGSAESRLHIKEIRYAKAENLKPILENIIKPPQGQGSDKSSVVGQYKFFEDVIIAADSGGGDDNRGSGNRLVISANTEDWKRLETFIEKLDKPQPQVAFEVLIVSISETQTKQLGTQLQSKGPVGMGINNLQFLNLADGDTPPKGTPPPLTNNLMNLTGGGNPSVLTFGKPGNLWAYVNTLCSISESQIISQPFLVTNNYQEATFEFSQTIHIPGPLDSQKGEPLQNKQIEQTAGTKVTLTPQINTDGIVNLKLDMTANNFKPAVNPAAGSDTDTNAINTRVSLAAGEVLVLGGLTKSNLSLTQYKTPILGDIPLIGNLFRNTTKEKVESNLYVFIRPSIIKPSFEGSPDEYTQLKLDYSKYQLMKNDVYAQNTDPIQRWFFKPENHSIKSTLADAKAGIFRPIDDFTYGKRQPKTVNIKQDPYFKVSESLKLKTRKKKRK